MELYVSQTPEAPKAASNASKKNCEACNYQDNYYGDQICRGKTN
jgi:hypothetical protein